MRARWLLLGWAVLGLVLWAGVFGLYVQQGVEHYLRLLAEFEAGRGPEPSLVAVMARARTTGALSASLWTLLIVAAGWTTTWYGGAER